MTSAFDVLGIGNAIVDVIARADDAFLSRHTLTKGSMRKTRGCRTIARPIETRCISPPESRSVLRSSRCSMRKVWAARATRLATSSALRRRRLDLSGNSRFSRTV